MTLNISDGTSNVDTAEITITIARLPQSIAALEAEAAKVLGNKETFTADNTVTPAKIKTVLGEVIDENKVEIYDKAGTKDKVDLEAATADAEGSLGFTLRFTAENGAQDEVSYTFTIDKLAQ